MKPLPPTPSHTVGPFYSHALPFPGGGEVAPPGHPDAFTLHGYVYDGLGAPVPDAIVEFWQAAPDGSLAGEPGSMRRNGVGFTGFGRVPTDPDGHYTLRTLPPGAPAIPYISLCVFARGLTHHLFTRAYLSPAPDALLASLEPERRTTLIAQPEPHRTHRFDVRLQGEGETVFLDFARHDLA